MCVSRVVTVVGMEKRSKRPCLVPTTPEADLVYSSTSDGVSEDDFIFPCDELVSQAGNDDKDSDVYVFLTESESDPDSLHLDRPYQGIDTTVHDQGEDKLLGDIGLLGSRCCKSFCVRDLTANEILMKFNSLTISNQRQWIWDKIIANSALCNGEMSTTYFVAGKNVCDIAFCKVHGFSISQLKRLKKSVRVVNELLQKWKKQRSGWNATSTSLETNNQTRTKYIYQAGKKRSLYTTATRKTQKKSFSVMMLG